MVVEKLGEVQPFHRIPLQKAAYQLLNVIRGRIVFGKSDSVLSFLDPPEQFHVVGGTEGRPADHHLIEHGANRPQVCLGIIFLIPKDLGCHVKWRATKGLCQRGGRKGPSEPKVRNLEHR
jgi:hypothetical protein